MNICQNIVSIVLITKSSYGGQDCTAWCSPWYWTRCHLSSKTLCIDLRLDVVGQVHNWISVAQDNSAADHTILRPVWSWTLNGQEYIHSMGTQWKIDNYVCLKLTKTWDVFSLTEKVGGTFLLMRKYRAAFIAQQAALQSHCSIFSNINRHLLWIDIQLSTSECCPTYKSINDLQRATTENFFSV